MNKIIIEPDLPIGTEFYFMENNSIKLGLIAGIKVYVTSCVEERGWWEQLFERYRKGKAKEVYKYSYDYEVKVQNSILCIRLNKEKSGYYIYGNKIYFTEYELKNSL